MKSFNRPKFKEETHLIPNKAQYRGVIDQENINLSFKYLCLENPKFQVASRNSQYFVKLIDRFKDLCNMKVGSFRSQPNKTLRNHILKWDETTEKCFGIFNEDQLVDQPWQFSVSVNEHGRVMGFFIDSTFNIVWFDPDHNVYK